MGLYNFGKGETDPIGPVRSFNLDGHGAFVVVCDHASNRIPPQFSHLGLSAHDRIRHIAWDPGALAVSIKLSEILDAPVVHSNVSRLVIDCNRTLDAPDLIPTRSEATDIPGNIDVTPQDREARVSLAHNPFHHRIQRLLDQRATAGLETVLVCMHSFTPSFHGVARPWPIGVIHGENSSFTRLFHQALAAELPDVPIGWNEPYSALRGVTYTLEHHGDDRGLLSTMIEIRHDEILHPSGVGIWAARIARALQHALREHKAAAKSAESPVVELSPAGASR
jgi:predicted N-formylglutamate amidohydrolase